MLFTQHTESKIKSWQRDYVQFGGTLTTRKVYFFGRLIMFKKYLLLLFGQFLYEHGTG